MPRSRTAKSAQATIPKGLKLFVRRRLMELQGLVLLGCLVALTVALAREVDDALHKAVAILALQT